MTSKKENNLPTCNEIMVKTYRGLAKLAEEEKDDRMILECEKQLRKLSAEQIKLKGN
jgi:hypothetical protein